MKPACTRAPTGARGKHKHDLAYSRSARHRSGFRKAPNPTPARQVHRSLSALMPACESPPSPRPRTTVVAIRTEVDEVDRQLRNAGTAGRGPSLNWAQGSVRKWRVCPQLTSTKEIVAAVGPLHARIGDGDRWVEQRRCPSAKAKVPVAGAPAGRDVLLWLARPVVRGAGSIVCWRCFKMSRKTRHRLSHGLVRGKKTPPDGADQERADAPRRQ